MKAKVVHIRKLLDYLFSALDNPNISREEIKRMIIAWSIRWCE